MSDHVIVSHLPPCDLHPILFRGEAIPAAAIDGKVAYGAWANMCTTCFDVAGVGLGTGLGQRLVVREHTDLVDKEL